MAQKQKTKSDTITIRSTLTRGCVMKALLAMALISLGCMISTATFLIMVFGPLFELDISTGLKTGYIFGAGLLAIGILLLILAGRKTKHLERVD